MHRIKSLRENRGWTQSDLERESGVAQAHISRLESGKAPNVSVTILAQIADALGTSLDYLTDRSDDPSSRPTPNHPSLRDPAFSEFADLWPELPEVMRQAFLVHIRAYLAEKERRD